MIGKLRGLVDDVDVTSCIIDVNGVGYLLTCSGRTLGLLPDRGMETTLIVETYVREDDIRLFGFSTPSERDAFKLLQNVQGVGAKVAMGILSVMSPSEIASAVSFQEKGMFTRVSGIGSKLADRLLVELKGKMDAFGLANIAAAKDIAVDQDAGDAVSALVNLGYGKEQAVVAVTQVRKDDKAASVDSLIRKGLRILAS